MKKEAKREALEKAKKETKLKTHNKDKKRDEYAPQDMAGKCKDCGSKEHSSKEHGK